MERDYVVSDDGVVRIDELEDLVAVRGGLLPEWGSAVALRDEVRIGREAVAYDSAGWVLVRRDGAAFDELRHGRLPNGASAAGRVYRHRDRILIGKQELAVQLDPGLDPDAARAWIEDRDHAVLRRSEIDENLLVIRTGADDPFELAARFRAMVPPVEFAEPLLLEVLEPRTDPDDPLYPYQWNLDRIGARQAWNVNRGARAKLAVVDLVFDASHEDLEDAVTGDSATRDPSGAWSWGLDSPGGENHGTVCASVAGARGWNTLGMVGVAPRSKLKLIALSRMSGDLVKDTDAIAEAFVFAIKARPPRIPKGADVISCSVGAGTSIVTRMMKKALWKCANRGRNGLGVPVFWAVGNGSGLDIADDEIACHGSVIAVGATEQDDSDYGHANGKWLELVAPGDDVIAAVAGDGYGNAEGTSVATPTAAAVAALVIAANPKLTSKMVRLILRFTAEKVGPLPYGGPWGRNDTFGHGLVNARSAVLLARWLKNHGIPP